ncbi:AP2/ERF domain [Sesbania bispinosa]|nr:AP2/ERF domain [Sesbania bispinosa]
MEMAAGQSKKQGRKKSSSEDDGKKKKKGKGSNKLFVREILVPTVTAGGNAKNIVIGGDDEGEKVGPTVPVPPPDMKFYLRSRGKKSSSSIYKGVRYRIWGKWASEIRDKRAKRKKEFQDRLQEQNTNKPNLKDSKQGHDEEDDSSSAAFGANCT